MSALWGCVVATIDRLDTLARVYDSQVHAVRASLEAFAARMWKGSPDYRDAAVERMVAAIVPRVTAGQVRTAQLTRAYLVECAKVLGLSTKVPVVDVAEVVGQRGVDPNVVYRRPAVSVYTALSEGKSPSEAVAAGGLRLLQLVGGDMQLAKRAQARSTMRASGVKAYRRILTGRENCALCLIASTQRYWVEDLLPIHPGCDCDVGPLPEGYDPAEQTIDSGLLEQVHETVAGAVGASDRGGRLPDYRDLVIETKHGEYGPVLAFKGTKKDRQRHLERKARQE